MGSRRHCLHPNSPLAQEGARKLWGAPLTLALQKGPPPFPGPKFCPASPLHHPSPRQLPGGLPKDLQLCPWAHGLVLAAVLEVGGGSGHSKTPLPGVL